MAGIKFGTDGWRGLSPKIFTFANARIVAEAVARYVVREKMRESGVIVATTSLRVRCGGARVAEVFSSTGTPSAH